MWVCAVACRDMVPDPAFFADCLRNAFHSLEHAALQQGHAEAPAEVRAAPARVSRKPRKKGA
jgi:hypothetical protein